MNGVSVSWDQAVPGASDIPKNQLVYFENIPVERKAKTEELGRPYYEDVLHVTFVTAGARDPIFRRKATEKDQVQYASQWARFKEQTKEVIEGTPLEAWPYLSKSQVLNLKAQGVHTVEQLSAVSDGARLECGIKIDLIEKAKLWLKKSEDSAAVTSAIEENRQLKAKVERLESQIADIVAKAEKKLAKKD